MQTAYLFSHEFPAFSQFSDYSNTKRRSFAHYLQKRYFPFPKPATSCLIQDKESLKKYIFKDESVGYEADTRAYIYQGNSKAYHQENGTVALHFK
ncbi:hypothetical protein UP17_11615 [Peribacillus simplex]|uniref:hypothetical protein n=1 Tax=Peribacillus simplex TaxID=1478 RepID=UPI000778194B|nr:hypothetical protein [Peribacillus simplex]AMM93077.1 hypothetical protein UP17_11615 [Peribacillus simplex]